MRSNYGRQIHGDVSASAGPVVTQIEVQTRMLEYAAIAAAGPEMLAPQAAARGTVLALGKTGGLQNFARSHGAETYETLSWGQNWKNDFLEIMNSSNTSVVVNLPHGDSAFAALQRSASGRGDPFDWEIEQIYHNRVQWGDRVTWYQDGEKVDNPF